MKYILTSASFILLFGFTSSAQTIERQVYNSFGSASQAGGISLATNVGEPITQTLFNSPQDKILTQGFLQPEAKDLNMDFTEPGSATTSVHIWPNPTTEGLFVSYENITTSTGNILIYDMAGKCLVIEPICIACPQQYISLPVLADGVYIVRVALSDKVFKDQKFIKVSK